MERGVDDPVGAQRPGEAGQRPPVGGDQRVVVAGVGEARGADDAAPDRPRQFPPRLDFAAARDHGDDADQQEGDQGGQPRALDRRLSTLLGHERDARRQMRACGAESVPNAGRRGVRSA